MRFLDKKLIKFLLVGVLNTIVGAGVMFLLYNLAHFGYWFSSVCNYIVGGVLSFFLNKYFTFVNHEKSIIQVIIYIANLIFCYVIAYLIAQKFVYFILEFQTESIRDNVSMFIGMCLYTGLNYFGQRLLVFSEKRINNGEVE